MKKKIFYSELAYVFGVILLSFATALARVADFGMSMVVAPAYILHLKISQFLPFFSFGMAEYTLQLFLIICVSVFMKKFKKVYLCSFITAVIYGFLLDFDIKLLSLIPSDEMWVRVLMFIMGMLICSFSVALLFHTYFAPEAYELVVKEVSLKLNKDISKVKTAYDMTSLCVSIILSFSFFGFMQFNGVNIGTLITALFNGFLIGKMSALLEKKFEFKDKLKMREFLEG